MIRKEVQKSELIIQNRASCWQNTFHRFIPCQHFDDFRLCCRTKVATEFKGISSFIIIYLFIYLFFQKKNSSVKKDKIEGLTLTVFG